MSASVKRPDTSKSASVKFPDTLESASVKFPDTSESASIKYQVPEIFKEEDDELSDSCDFTSDGLIDQNDSPEIYDTSRKQFQPTDPTTIRMPPKVDLEALIQRDRARMNVENPPQILTPTGPMVVTPKYKKRMAPFFHPSTNTHSTASGRISPSQVGPSGLTRTSRELKITYATLNLDASNRTSPELTKNDVVHECIMKILARMPVMPSIITFTEVSNEVWINDHFEAKTGYWGVCSKKTDTKIYTAWQKDRYRCLRVIECSEGRYILFVLQHIDANASIAYVSIHNHRKKVDMRRAALKDACDLCQELIDDYTVCGAIIAGDFNDIPSRVETYIPKTCNLGVCDDRVPTTQRNNSIDNSIVIEGTYRDKDVLYGVKDFTHYPIYYTVAFLIN